MNWMTGLQRAIDYVEEHILEDLDLESIAAQSFSSSYHFQRVFSIVCDMTIGEYVRSRRLSLAGADLARGDVKVIDVAMNWKNGTGSIFLTMRLREWILWKVWRWKILLCLNLLI